MNYFDKAKKKIGDKNLIKSLRKIFPGIYIYIYIYIWGDACVCLKPDRYLAISVHEENILIKERKF